MSNEGAPTRSYNPFRWLRNLIDEWKVNRPGDLNETAMKGRQNSD